MEESFNPHDRMNKDMLEKLANKHARHFADPTEKNHPQCIFPEPLVPWSSYLDWSKNFSARRLIDLQSHLIEAFEQVLAQPKEQHATIFKNLAIRTHSS